MFYVFYGIVMVVMLIFLKLSNSFYVVMINIGNSNSLKFIIRVKYWNILNFLKIGK